MRTSLKQVPRAHSLYIKLSSKMLQTQVIMGQTLKVFIKLYS